MAEFGFDEGIRKPQTMVVSGNSVIDDENTMVDDEIVNPDINKDDAKAISDAETSAPAMPDVNPFQPAPLTPEEQKQKIKRVVKKIPTTTIPRSFADDRIDDSYVQEMVRDSFNYTPEID